ncbi:MAG: replication initiation protein [Sulfurimonadaceae bacterium]|nr:replication initiation protein [Sulfurimonadaceae bacterium]
MESISKKRQQFSIKNEFNELDFSFFRLNEFSINLLLLLVTQIDSKNDEDFFTYQLTTKELEEIFKKKRINKLTIHKAREELFEQTIQISLKEESPVEINIFSVFTIDGNLLQLKLNDAFKRFFLTINSKTPYFKGYMNEFLALKNVNTKRIYLLLRQLLNRRYNKQYSITELLHTLGFKENQYKNFKDLNSKVIKSSVDSINEFTSLDVEVVQIKSAHKVVKVEFVVTETKSARDKYNHNEKIFKDMYEWANNEESLNFKNASARQAVKEWVGETNCDEYIDIEVLRKTK